MTQQQLDLLKFTAGRAAQLRAGPAQIMRRDAGDAYSRCVVPEHLPYDLFAEPVAGNVAGAVHRPENVASVHARRAGPCVNGHLDPGRHRSRADATVLPHEIHNAPAAIALLDVGKRERGYLRAPEPAAKQYGQNRAVAQAADRCGVRRVEKTLRLTYRQTVAHADTDRFRAFHSANACRPTRCRSTARS
ncbi:MAG TPA: hypothetical protein VN841_23905 [Bryobacteraceae bacterium]|nr:hypothetical protein [Bryobacteraceae bacterium]